MIETKINKAIQEIQRGSSEIIGLEYIKKLVRRFYEKGKRYIVKAGFDPTAPDLHFGHSVLIQKLATFQKYGGDVKFLIGDFTAMIGDPTGKSETRKILNKDEVLKNAQTYKDQVLKILDINHLEICFNSRWLNKLDAHDILSLTAKFSVARMLERDDFTKRYKDGVSISIIEFIYPLLQGYDSVALECDIECGGSDQKFNLLVGRSIQKAYGLYKEQAIVTTPLLEGLDGVNKMSKSMNNYIAIYDTPYEMYAKIMSVSDSMMLKYYELLSKTDLQELKQIVIDIDKGVKHPKTIKENLALELVSRYHSSKDARDAKERFDLIFTKNSTPDDIQEFVTKPNAWICKVLVDSKMVLSSSEARRSIKAGAIRINGQKITDENLKINSKHCILQIGKRKFLKVLVK